MCCVVSGSWCPTVEPHAAENQRAARLSEHRGRPAHSCEHAEGMSHVEVNHSHDAVYTHRKHVSIYIAIVAVIQIKCKVLLDQLTELHDKLLMRGCCGGVCMFRFIGDSKSPAGVNG